MPEMTAFMESPEAAMPEFTAAAVTAAMAAAEAIIMIMEAEAPIRIRKVVTMIKKIFMDPDFRSSAPYYISVRQKSLITN